MVFAVIIYRTDMVSSFLDDVIMGLECRVRGELDWNVPAMLHCRCQPTFIWTIDFSFCHDPGVIMKWFEHVHMSVWPSLKWRF